MTTILTGAGGYLGRLTAVALANNGHELLLLDRSFPGAYEPPAGDHAVRVADLADARGLQVLIDGLGRPVDAIVHAAAVTAHPRELGITALEYVERHVVAGLNMLRLGRACGARYLFVSSAAVFAKHQTGPIDETRLPQPHGPYAAAKRMLELATYEAGDDGSDTAVVRLGNLYGGGERPGPARPRTSLVQRMVETALQTHVLSVSKASELREWTYAPDVAGLIAQVLRGPFPEDRTLHLSSGESLSREAIARQIAALLPDTEVALESDGPSPTRGPLVSSRVRPDRGWTPFRVGLEATVLAAATSADS